MTIRKQNKLLQVDERETFKVRKSKKYKNLCSFAFGVLAISGLAAAPASADEVVATTDTTPIAVTESVVESPAPSTNLIEAQPEATVEAVQQQETVGQQSGEIAVVNASDDLNTAVATAQQEGVKVVPEEPKDYGVTTSVEETDAKQEEIQEDYASQAGVINKATEAYVEAKAIYQKETSKIIEENNNLKAEYEAAVERYNKEVSEVNAKNEAIDAAYDEAHKSYEAEVAKVDAENEAIRLRNSKAQEVYDKAMQTYESDLAKYEAAVAEAQANTTKIGYASEVITQALVFDSEPNADYTVSGSVKLVEENDESRTYSLNKGETIVITYTGLENSTYDGTELSKVVYSYTAKSDNLNLYILKDPTVTVVLQPNNSATTSGESRVNLKSELYDKDGNIIEFSEEKPAVISLSSLNRNSVYDGVGLGEAVAITSNNSEFVSINGSTIAQNGNVISSSISDNHNRSLGSKYDANNDGVNVTDGNPNNYWDNYASPLRYYGAGLLKVTSGTSIEIDIFRNWENSEIAHTGDYYFGFNTKVGTSSELIPTAPNKPTLKLEEELEYPDEPTKADSIPLPDKPEEPTYQELPEAPEVPTVSYRLATLATQPQVSKGVETTEGVNVDKGLVAKGQPVVFVLNVDDLPADRSLTTSGDITDALPTGFVISLEETVNANPSYELGYDTDTHVLSGIFTKNLLQTLNQDVTTSASIPSLVVHGYVTNDAATYKNAFVLNLNGGEGKVNGYTTTSNLVVIHTAGDPDDPDNPTNNEIEPLKANTNARGVNINGKVVPIGGTNYYTITLDYDQYADIEVDAETILKGFGAFDDYPEEALTVDLSRATIIDSDGQVVTGLTLKDNSSVSSVDDSTKALLTSSQINGKIKGAFISIVADDPTSYYQNIIKTKKSVTITIPMTVNDSLYNTGQSYSNTAYQVDFGNGYVTNTVTNSTPVVTPTKNNTNSEGVIINGKPVLANSVNYYKVVLDYSAYEGIEADEELIAQGFFAVDDYPEEALIVETTGIQLQDSDNSIPKGVTTTVYASLSEAPEAVQTAMSKQGFTPKGAIIVLSADDPKEFYETYIKTGKIITATLPMTVKAELAKTGGTYENTAYQVDFGTAYVTDTIVNNVPKLDPKKDVVIDLTHSNESLNDQDIEVGTVFNYKLSGAEIPADRGSKITSYTWLDVLDERDQYDGVHKIYAPVVFELKDGTVIEKGTELTRFAIQSYDVETRRVYTALDEEFLAQISDLSAFKSDLYLQVKRVGTGDVENTAIHAVNEAEVSTNTVVTHTPVGNVIVRYFEEGTGLVLKPQVIDEDGVATGTNYDTTDRKVDRIVTEDGKTYQLVRHEGSETGKVVKGDTIVDYFYEEVLGLVEVEYKDKEGNVIKTPVVDTEEGSTGRDYDTTDNKPTEIVTEEGKTYRLVPELTEGNETGKVVEGKTTITYIYEEVKADVLVHYIDEDGNVIAETVKDTDQGSTGTAYDTTDHKPEYITVDGVRYKLMPKKTIGEETGILTEDGAEVTYVYHKIVTNWVEEGTNKVLKDREDGEHERGEIPDYDYVETVVDEETGDITHIFKQVSKPVETKTETPTVTPTVATKAVESTPVVKQAAVTSLPNTGDASGSIAAIAGAMSTVFGLVGIAKRKKED